MIMFFKLYRILWNLIFDRIKNEKPDAKQGSWILGGGWNSDFWGGELPAASWIDDITPYNPVSLLNEILVLS